MPVRQPSGSDPGRRPPGRRGAWWWRIALAVLLVWLASGLRRVGPDAFGVLEGPLFAGRARHVDPGWTLAPVGLLRLTVYPRHGIEIALPQAEEARLRSPDGSRFGFRGWATLRAREQSWKEMHRAAGGAGLPGVLLDAVRAAGRDLPPLAAMQGRIDPALARELERHLSTRLTERGVDLRRLAVDSIDYLAVEQGAVAEPTGARLLVIGLDGADWEIIDALLERGKLPHLRGLIDDGVRAKLLTVSPMLSPVVWTTVATGVEPSRHGILDFVVADPDGGTQQPVTSAQRKVPTVWEMLSRSGVEVGVTAWWASWPADAVRGYLVSDRISYQLFGFRSDIEDAQGKTWPPELYDEIRPSIVTPESVGWERVEPYLGGSRRRRDEFDAEEQTLLDDFRTLLASGDTYSIIGEMLRRRFEPQLEVIFFEGTDTVGHLFMPYRPPLLPAIDPARFESFAPIVDRYYETADEFVGEILEGRDDSWTILVLSDHGFASDATRPRGTDSRIGHGPAADWHRRFGILILSGAHVAADARIDETSVFDIAPTILALFGQPIPRSWPGHVLAGALEDAFLERHPVRYRPDDPDRRELHADSMLDPAAADLLEKLQSLGYISASSGGSDSMTARNNAGVALLAEGRYADAEAEFRQGLEVEPGAPMLWVNLGLALRFQGKAGEAVALFERAIDQPAAMRVAAHQLAQIRMERGELEGAEQVLRRVLEREPGAAELRNLLGLTLERRGDLAAAEREYGLAADLDPDAALARNNLGNLAKRRGDLDLAESWYGRAIEADPYFMGAYNNLALVYQLRGEMERAIDLYRRALAKAPNNAVVLNNLASLHYAKGEFEEAGRIWTRATRADPTYPSPLNNLASLQINAERLDQAEELLSRALQLDPDYGDARMNLALVMRGRGRLDAAHEELVLATADPRTGIRSWLQLGLLELEMGETERSIATLEQARERMPQNTELLNALGEAHLRSGRADEAIGLWRDSLEIDPGQERLRRYVEQLESSAP